VYALQRAEASTVHFHNEVDLLGLQPVYILQEGKEA
jgi:hypothetical protein